MPVKLTRVCVKGERKLRRQAEEGGGSERKWGERQVMKYGLAPKTTQPFYVQSFLLISNAVFQIQFFRIPASNKGTITCTFFCSYSRSDSFQPFVFFLFQARLQTAQTASERVQGRSRSHQTGISISKVSIIGLHSNASCCNLFICILGAFSSTGPIRMVSFSTSWFRWTQGEIYEDHHYIVQMSMCCLRQFQFQGPPSGGSRPTSRAGVDQGLSQCK